MCPDLVTNHKSTKPYQAKPQLPSPLIKDLTPVLIHSKQDFACLGIPQLDQHIVTTCDNFGPIRRERTSINLNGG